MKIAIAGTGYVGLSMAVLLSQRHQVVALDIVPAKVKKFNRKQSPVPVPGARRMKGMQANQANLMIL